ncbi:hypothetical protein FQR65_LT12909 [Abscondita terminalis]|nr:hypothetical protein FQR65_LT12909 [Abscondita terminalis]
MGKVKLSRVCALCKKDVNDELKFGALRKIKGMRVHYYCLLLSETISQSGQDDEGILGFVASDIVKEVNRTKNQKCCYCRESPATIGCANTFCNRKFHVHCGYENGAVFNFDKFDARCSFHTKSSNVPAHIRRFITDYHCLICLEEFDAETKISDIIWANCCKSNVILHCNCVRKMALNAGYFTKCPGCNDKTTFLTTIKAWGIFVPEQDASWELDRNAFSELLYVHSSCDQKNCSCPNGREYSEDNGKWRIMLCKMCGSVGSHAGCSELKRKFICDVCSCNTLAPSSTTEGVTDGDEVINLSTTEEEEGEIEILDDPHESADSSSQPTNIIGSDDEERKNASEETNVEVVDNLMHDNLIKKRPLELISNIDRNDNSLRICKKYRASIDSIENSNDVKIFTETILKEAPPSYTITLDDNNEVEFVSCSEGNLFSPQSTTVDLFLNSMLSSSEGKKVFNKENELNCNLIQTCDVQQDYLTERGGKSAAFIVQSWSFNSIGYETYEKVQLQNILNLPVVQLPESSLSSKPHNLKCTYWDCFNIYRCGQTGHDRISVYVYPLKNFVDSKQVPATDVMSKQYYMILESIIESKYYTANPQEACLFVPSIDTLNQERIQPGIISKAFQSLPYWRDGENHLLFNMVSGNAPDFATVLELNTGNALIAGAGFNTNTYRIGFDISIPIYSPIAKFGGTEYNSNLRPWFIISSQINIDSYFLDELQDLQVHNSGLLILDSCQAHNYTKRCEYGSHQHFPYPDILQKATFCLVFRGERMSQLILLEALAANCIPVVVMDGVVLPFNNVIDWKRASVFIMEDYLNTLFDILKKISRERIEDMRKQVRFLYNRYFSSMKSIVETTLDIVQDRVYPHWGKTYDDWNMRPDEMKKNPLFLPITAPRSQGFTAAILTYDRVESLFLLIEKLSKVPSMSKIIVIWNNQRKSPPPLSAFPNISKPLKVIYTKANKLSNRFYPFEEIETEAILTIDDDIVMLTADELEFGYEVWREFPDRIVGFPSRTHIWDNTTLSWKYESEWTNEISMVLTGAAFHHKYWSYLYTTTMPAEVRDWVDEHMNCEDIAMNFLVANVTNKPPIKVTPRKKFRSVNNDMLSADMGHMIERSKCVDRFTKAFGRMPLKSVEFRADPVLYKDTFPEKLKRFNDIGSL